jgi:hypothetical protein
MRRRLGSLVITTAALFGAAVFVTACLPMPPGGGGGTTTTTQPHPVTTTTLKAGEPIGPHQHYDGIVNGQATKPVIYVVCPGPAAGGTGPPAAGQTVAVHQVASGGGDTGSSAHEIWAQFGKDLFHVVAFQNYDTPGEIPTTLQLPCQGTGVVDFTTCFGTLPCAADAVDDLVTVTFENIAV